MSTNPELLNRLQTARDNYIAACGGDIATANTYIAKIVLDLKPGFRPVTLQKISETPELAAAVMAKLAAGPEAPPRSAFDIILDAIEVLPAQCTAEGKTDIYARITGARNVLNAEQLGALVQALQRKLPKKSVQEIRDELDVRWHGKASPDATARSRAPFVFITMPEDLITCEFPKRAYAIFPYFPQGVVAFLSSIGGFGKSYLALYIAVCKALGLSQFCGRSCTPGRVVVLSAEDDKAEMLRRLQRVLRYLQRQGVVIDMTLLRANLQLIDRTGMALENMLVIAQRHGAIPTDLPEHIVQQIGKAELIVIDTQSRFNGAPENDNTAAAVFVSACEVIASKTSACVLVLNHTGKAVAREGIVDQYVGRGASAYPDNARSVMVLAAPIEKQLKQFEIDPEEVERADVFRLAHLKHSYGQKADDVFLRRQDDGVVAPFTPTQRDVVTEEDRTWQLLRYIGDGEITRNLVRHKELKSIFGEGFARSGAEGIFDSAVKAGLLTHKRNYKNADYYKLSDGAMKELAARAEVEAAARRKDDAEFNAPYARAPQPTPVTAEETPQPRKERKPRKDTAEPAASITAAPSEPTAPQSEVTKSSSHDTSPQRHVLRYSSLAARTARPAIKRLNLSVVGDTTRNDTASITVMAAMSYTELQAVVAAEITKGASA